MWLLRRMMILRQMIPSCLKGQSGRRNDKSHHPFRVTRFFWHHRRENHLHVRGDERFTGARASYATRQEDTKMRKRDEDEDEYEYEAVQRFTRWLKA